MENLKKRFIIEENLGEKKIEGYVERLLQFCKVTTNGEILITADKLTTLEKVKIALVARFLANKLDANISAEMTHEELSTLLEIPRNQIRARLKDVRATKFGFDSGNGLYKVKPLTIGKFLDELESKYGVDKK